MHSLNSKILKNETHLYDRGYLLGDALFETILYHKKKLEYIDEHLNRLASGAEFLEMSHPGFDIKKSCLDLLLAQSLIHDTCSVRITLSRESKKRGISITGNEHTNLLITANKYDITKHKAVTGYITDVKINEYSKLTKFKTTNFLEYIYARNQAGKKGFDEGILINTQGKISETCIGNIFLIEKSGSIITPPLSDGPLPGIIREKIISLLSSRGIEVTCRSILPNEIFTSESIFFTNSLQKIQFFSKINDHMLVVPNMIGNISIDSILKALC